ncbi:Peroxidase [Mycena venus]|uniref:Peroxidase n=1 Tax=Mycena venus TaxID=2733690 RepID=A0A8H6Z046_9AGAR|nr:Peroxidase [Mycena venus]
MANFATRSITVLSPLFVSDFHHSFDSFVLAFLATDIFPSSQRRIHLVLPTARSTRFPACDSSWTDIKLRPSSSPTFSLFAVNGPSGRSSAADWIRTAYHDIATHKNVDCTGSMNVSIRTPPTASTTPPRLPFPAANHYDGNVTMHSFATAPPHFVSTCAMLFAPMLDTVPRWVKLTEAIAPFPVKPYGLELTLGAAGEKFGYTIRPGRSSNRTTASRTSPLPPMWQCSPPPAPPRAPAGAPRCYAFDDPAITLGAGVGIIRMRFSMNGKMHDQVRFI